ncbi:glycosyltransferase WbuB [uncultured Endozoicomonas sp.]|uniref:glycosyltransferase WbuB n=1 Tax=uncultured Endozoicomonas sp. TaxID=432652 RepID=UPI0026185212|nr:glycosyltransferase WbuB [uncultured Endozoicomonas sp.]
MKILLYGINYTPELTGIGKYSGEMSVSLASQGHDVRVITAPPYYPEWQVGEGYKAWQYKTEMREQVKVIRCPLYVPAKVSTIKRIIHLASFAASSFFQILAQWRWKPNVIITIEPTMFCTPAALLLGKLCGAKTLLHVQDFEIDAMFGLFVSSESSQESGSFFKKLVFGIEKWITNSFDRVSSISFSMLENAARKGVSENKRLFFPNWVDTAFVTPDVDGSTIRERFGYATDDLVILYSGNLGEKQGLEIVLEAANHFQQESLPRRHGDTEEKIKDSVSPCLRGEKNIQFCIVGNGASKARLEQQAKEQNLTNLKFLPLQPYEDLPALLAMADIHLVVQKKGAADIVLPSKLTGILSAGGYSLITAEKETELGRLCNNFPGIAERVEPEDLNAFIAGLSTLLENVINADGYNKTARQYALDYLNKDAVLNRFEQDLVQLVAGN